MYQLHVWGPAFGLPSIDAECIAAIAYFNSLLPSGFWVLVVAYDSSTSPSGNFPLLRHESGSVSGFDNIVNFLDQRNESLDKKLTPKSRADCTALSAHLNSQCLPLVDATLYSSSSNYEEITRPAFTNILPTHANYTIPPARHALAESRTDPLGLSVDDLPHRESDDARRQLGQEVKMISTSPSLLFKSNATFQAALSQQQSRVRFRMEGLLEDALEPLSLRLQQHSGHYLLDTEYVTSVDCLAYGYLSLLLYPELPKPWVSDSLHSKHKRVVAYTDKLRNTVFQDVQFSAQEIMKNAPGLFHEDDKYRPVLEALPWRLAPASGIVSATLSLGRSAFSNIVNPTHQALLMRRRLLDTNTSLTPPHIPFIASASLTFVAAMVGYVIYGRVHIAGIGERDKYFGPPRPRIFDLGAAGEALAAFR